METINYLIAGFFVMFLPILVLWIATRMRKTDSKIKAYKQRGIEMEKEYSIFLNRTRPHYGDGTDKLWIDDAKKFFNNNNLN